MSELGIKIVIYANHILRTIISSANQTLGEISRVKELSSIDQKIANLSEVFELTGMKDLKENEKLYNSTDRANIQTIIPAAGNPLAGIDIENNDNTPTCLLKLNNKKIINKNIETLSSCGLQNITIVTGFKSNLFDTISVNKVENKLIGKE